MTQQDRIQDSRFTTTLLLASFLGTFGVHRFYTGRIGTGLLMLLTGGGFMIWAIVDLVIIAQGEYRDKNGTYIRMSQHPGGALPSERSFDLIYLLCGFLGTFGVHRFAVGRFGTGLLMLLTFGGFLIWQVVDLIPLALGRFRDSEGREIRQS